MLEFNSSNKRYRLYLNGCFSRWRSRLFRGSALPLLLLFLAALLPGEAQQAMTVETVELPDAPGVGQFADGSVLIEGVQASGFRPALWRADTLNWVPDLRYPLLSPRRGKFQNIYAPSAVEEPWGWRLYYSGWDGSSIAQDCVYESKTTDFLSFRDREMVIDHGAFRHTSNAVVQKLADGDYQMVATADIQYPGPYEDTNKPVIFHSGNGDSWNGNKIPYLAQPQDVLPVFGYPRYDQSHLNGGHVLLESGGESRFIFKDSHQDKRLFWAYGSDPAHLSFGGDALNTDFSANDLRKFTVDGQDLYLLALYKKGDIGLGTSDTNGLWFTLSSDGLRFPEHENLIQAAGPSDRFIFSVGFVTEGSSVLGVLYGAGAAPKEDRNRIFASWLQKRVVLSVPGRQSAGDKALGPNWQRIKLPGGSAFEGTIDVYDDDGETLLASTQVYLEPGAAYRLIF